MQRLNKQLYPKNKNKSEVSLYSLRHQFGSNLKAAVAQKTISDKEASYMMGHQSAKSISAYGNKQNGGGMTPTPGRSCEMVRGQAQTPPAPAQEQAITQTMEM